MINAFAVALPARLGAAAEALGYERMLKTKCGKTPIHSLFRQDCMLYDLTPMMPEGTLPSEADLSLNLPILLFSFAASTLAGLLFGDDRKFRQLGGRHADALEAFGDSAARRKIVAIRRQTEIAEFARNVNPGSEFHVLDQYLVG